MNRKITTLVLGIFFSVVAILPQQALAFGLDDLLDPFDILDDTNFLPGLPLPGFNNNEPQTVNNTNINSNNINSNVNSPGGVVNGATNVSNGDDSHTTIHTIDPGYVTTQPGSTYYTPTPYPTPYQTPYPTPYPTPYYQNLDVSCYAIPTYVYRGDTVTWRAQVNGGTGNYSYYWNGSDGISSGSSVIYKNYSSSGTKSASVTVTSGNQTVTRSCGTVTVSDYNYNNDYNNNYNYYTPLQVSCGVTTTYGTTGTPVNWYSNVSGGNGSYQYSWSGTDGLTGNSSSLSTAYNYAGVKTAILSVWSDGQHVTRNCGSTNITSTGYGSYGNYSTVQPSGLSCSANVSSAQAGSPVTWSATIPSYGYSTVTWGGTDGLYGTGQTLRTTYLKSGAKSAYMTVSLNGQSSTVVCNNTVQVTGTYTAPKAPSKPSKPSYSASSPLEVMCMASTDTARVGDSVIWTTNVSGGNGTYKYTWMGSDNLVGANSMVFKSYSLDGIKAAAVTVTSGTKTVTQTCSNVVAVGNATLSANSLFSFSNIPWGLISILVILILIASIGYLLMSRSKI